MICRQLVFVAHQLRNDARRYEADWIWPWIQTASAGFVRAL